MLYHLRKAEFTALLSCVVILSSVLTSLCQNTTESFESTKAWLNKIETTPLTIGYAKHIEQYPSVQEEESDERYSYCRVITSGTAEKETVVQSIAVSSEGNRSRTWFYKTGQKLSDYGKSHPKIKYDTEAPRSGIQIADLDNPVGLISTILKPALNANVIVGPEKDGGFSVSNGVNVFTVYTSKRGEFQVPDRVIEETKAGGERTESFIEYSDQFDESGLPFPKRVSVDKKVLMGGEYKTYLKWTIFVKSAAPNKETSPTDFSVSPMVGGQQILDLR